MEKEYIGKWLGQMPITIIDPMIYLGFIRFFLMIGMHYASDEFLRQYNIRQL